MIIRLAEEKDMEDIIKLRIMLLIEEGTCEEKDISAEFRDYLHAEMNKNLFVAVAEEEGNIISTCAVIIQKYPPAFGNPKGLRAYVTNVYTLPAYRRQGINTKLMDLLLEDVKKQGISYVWLWATKDGVPMYEKYGFSDVKSFATMDLLL